MFDKTITIGSAGKSFSVTGWKTGWVIAPKHIAEAGDHEVDSTT